MIEKRHDWPERLAESLQAADSRAFAWGETDCCLLVCDAVLAMTDIDLAADFRGKYSSQLGAAIVIRQFCEPQRTQSLTEEDLPEVVSASSVPSVSSVVNDSIEQLAVTIAERNDIPEIPPGFAQRGDVVLFDQRAASSAQPAATLGIVDTHGTHAVSIAPDGPVRILVCACRRAWRIG